MGKQNKRVGEPATIEAAEYTKEQLLKAAGFRNRRDLVEALLDSGRNYTIAEAEEIIENYLKGEVK